MDKKIKTLTPNAAHGIFVSELFSDVGDACMLLEEDQTSQFARRVFLRVVVSDLEAKTDIIRTDLLTEESNDRIALDINEVSVLTNLNVKVSETGKITTKHDNWHRTLSFIACVFRTAIEKTGGSPDSFFCDNRWKLLKKTFEVRHRITHPKLASDINVSDQEYEDAKEVTAWMMVKFLKLYGEELETAKKAGIT